MDQSVEGDHRIKGSRLVFPRDHVSLLEGSPGHQLPSSFDLHGGNVEPEDVEVPFGQQLCRGNAGAAAKIEDSGVRPQQPRQIIDPSRIPVRTLLGRWVRPTVVVAVRARDGVVAAANKIAPAGPLIPVRVCHYRSVLVLQAIISRKIDPSEDGTGRPAGRPVPTWVDGLMR